MTKLDDLVKRTARVAKVGAVFAREYQYIVAAELPIDGNKKKASVKEPTVALLTFNTHSSQPHKVPEDDIFVTCWLLSWNFMSCHKRHAPRV
eukprot:scaffold38362_cov283-Skeletonema_dohrnii-CCMP3373.AAC.1